MTTSKKVVLMPELVPAALWGRSAYRMLGQRAVWKKQIRADALAKTNNCCSICGASAKRLVCHDEWQYDDNRGLATLVGFEIHCGECDTATYPGLALSIYPREETEKIILAQLCKVNDCTKREAKGLIKKATEVWIERNKKDWKLKVAPALIKKYPELAALPKFTPQSMTFVIR